jgi:hypothetical protein
VNDCSQSLTTPIGNLFVKIVLPYETMRPANDWIRSEDLLAVQDEVFQGSTVCSDKPSVPLLG